MEITQAKKLINQEYNSDNGLDIFFRMSADIEAQRIQKFITALKTIGNHYEDKQMIEKNLVYQLFSMHQTLQASVGHWKLSRPKGLDQDTCFEIFTEIQNIFSN